MPVMLDNECLDDLKSPPLRSTLPAKADLCFMNPVQVIQSNHQTIEIASEVLPSAPANDTCINGAVTRCQWQRE